MRNNEPTFQQFWEAYGLKRDRLRAERAWNRMSAKDKRAAMDGIKPYRQDCADHNRMMMYAQGYLNNRRWEDDFSADAEVKNDRIKEKSEAVLQSVQPAGGLPTGTRPATEDELRKLYAFRLALTEAPELKPCLRKQYETEIIQHLSIPYVREHTDIIHLCIEREGKLERITEFMIDYYDSYQNFYRLLGQFFDVKKLTFSI